MHQFWRQRETAQLTQWSQGHSASGWCWSRNHLNFNSQTVHGDVFSVWYIQVLNCLEHMFKFTKIWLKLSPADAPTKIWQPSYYSKWCWQLKLNTGGLTFWICALFIVMKHRWDLMKLIDLCMARRFQVLTINTRIQITEYCSKKVSGSHDENMVQIG